MGDIVNNKAHHRFELVVDGHLAAAFYKIDGNVITFVHTEVPPELGGSSTTRSKPPASTRQRQPPSNRATTELVFGRPSPGSVTVPDPG